MQYYSWVLTFHIMAVMSWMALLFYLPRLFVYHVEHKNKKDFTDVVKIQELKIYKVIGAPAMWASIISGAIMLYLNPYLLSSEAGGWMHAKLLVVFFLVLYTFSLEKYRKDLEVDKFEKSGNFFRAYNEVPTILSLLIVGYVITKTFSILFTVITLLIGAFIIYKVLKQTPKEAK
ncbi:protoporphyrinogen oxidase HemJ [Arcobacter sp. YIC-80]|uniref:protoporphyrinogen oxidase HemJ n=1 Tax=unclassified Arcobacter TaxID=2593671 RepID=UPI003850EC6C